MRPPARGQPLAKRVHEADTRKQYAGQTQPLSHGQQRSGFERLVFLYELDHEATAEVSQGGDFTRRRRTDLYYWYQAGWILGNANCHVVRLGTSDFAELDVTSDSVSDFSREPLDAPILLDEANGRLFVKNKVFDTEHLTTTLYTFPGLFSLTNGNSENAYALDTQGGLMATHDYIFELARYDVVARTLRLNPDQLFFDADGGSGTCPPHEACSVTALAEGPWPMPGGNRGNTRRVDR